MVQKASYDVSAWKLEALTGPDPSDDFSQEAAKNRKPPLGTGLTEKVEPRKKAKRPESPGATPEHDDPGHPTHARDTVGKPKR